jgi:hypothetical protein
MSTVPETPTSPPPLGQPPHSQSEIRVVSHSNLFYWWPVWLVGYIMALLTLLDGHLLAVVPPETEVVVVTKNMSGEKKGSENIEVKMKDREVLVPKSPKSQLTKPKNHMAANKNLGVIFCTVLLLVIAITNIPLRGLWSVMVIVIIIFTSIILGLMDKWKYLLDALEWLDIHINLAGYVVISTVVLALWLVSFFFFDQQIYMVFTPGQVRVRLEIGEGETAFPTMGITFKKQRSDLFRHWILGLGSGDLLVTTGGSQAQHFDLPNVLFVGRKVKAIEEMLRTMPTVRNV